MKPVILLGMPRSGTKLLRSFLNQHPKINIPHNESYLIHNSIRKFGESFDFSVLKNRIEYFQFLTTTKFYGKCKADGFDFTFEDFERLLSVYDWQHVFKLILNFYGPKGPHHQFLWGDKSPGTFSQLKYIHQIFPNAYIVHIVRDPRDYCLSAKNAWGKNVFRSVHRWNLEINYYSKLVNDLGINSINIKYEDLIDSPIQQLEKICEFLNIEYPSGLENLQKTVENIGSTKGKPTVVKGNKEKYIKAFNPKTISKLEGIGKEGMVSMGYPISYQGKSISLNPIYLKYASLMDGLHSLQFHMKNKGLLEGFSYFSKLHSNKR